MELVVFAARLRRSCSSSSLSEGGACPEPVMKPRLVPLVALVVLTGCVNIALPPYAPQECHFGDAEVLWAAHASLNQLGLESDLGFPPSRPVDIFITANPHQGSQRRYCAVLPEGDPVVGRFTFEGDVPDDWEPPTP